MANIVEKIAQIRQAILGKEVRESLAQGIEAINAEVESTTLRQSAVDAAEIIRNEAEEIRIDNENTRISEHTQAISEVTEIKGIYDAASKANINVELTKARSTFPDLDARLINHESQLSDNMSLAINVIHPPLGIKSCTGDINSDDTAALTEIINFCKANPKYNKLAFPNGVFNISAELPKLPSGMKWIGVGRPWSLDVAGTFIRRTADATVLDIDGTDETTPYTNVSFENMTFYDQATTHTTNPFINLKSCHYFLFRDCLLMIRDKSIVIERCYDSRFENTDFSSGGNDTNPLLELKGSESSSDGINVPNSIMFVECRWESYRGSAIKTTGYNVNEIWLKNCKFESEHLANGPHLDFQNCSSLSLDIQICSRGEVPKIINFDNVDKVNGLLNVEYAWITADITNPVAKLYNCNKFDIDISFVPPTQYLTSYICELSGSTSELQINCNANNINTVNSGRRTNPRALQGQLVVYGESPYSSVLFKFNKSDKEGFAIGNMSGSAGSRQFNITRYNADGTSTAVGFITPAGNITLNGNLTANIVRGSTAGRPTGVGAGRLYIDTTLNKLIWYDGTNWRDAMGTIV